LIIVTTDIIAERKIPWRRKDWGWKCRHSLEEAGKMTWKPWLQICILTAPAIMSSRQEML